jgi:hypothetical protein
MVPSSRTPLRPDRLRALNLPSAVEVGIDAWGRPTWVMDSTGEREDVRTRDPAASRAHVEGEGSGGGAPVGLDGKGGEAPVGRMVEEVVETWIVQDEWWRCPIHRRYVEVVLEGGGHVVLFEDLTTGEWFMQRP